MQQNAKTVNSIELNKLLNYDTDPYSLAQTNALSNVAYQPAMLGGKAVYNARGDLKLRVEDGAASLRVHKNVESESDKSIDVTLLPNPSSGIFKVTTNLDEKFNVIIKDLSGKIVFKKSYCKGQQEFYLEHLSNGIYFLILDFISGKQKTVKLFINRQG